VVYLVSLGRPSGVNGLLLVFVRCWPDAEYVGGERVDDQWRRVASSAKRYSVLRLHGFIGWWE
jgi:hypothetical protein